MTRTASTRPAYYTNKSAREMVKYIAEIERQ